MQHYQTILMEMLHICNSVQNIIDKKVVVDIETTFAPSTDELSQTIPNYPTSHILTLCVRKHEISVTQFSCSNRPYRTFRRIREIG